MRALIRAVWQAGALLLLAAAAGAVTARFHPRAPELETAAEIAGPGEITVAEAGDLVKTRGVIWIDARHPDQFAKGTIPGAIPLNQYDWENGLIAAFNLIADAPRERVVIIFCDGQKCEASKHVREQLRQTPLGDRELLILHGGWPSWAAAHP